MEISILGFILLSENSILSFSTFPSGCPTWRSEWPFQQVQHCYLLLFIVIICYHDIYHYQPILMWYDPKATTINPRISISTSFPVSPAHRFPGMEPQQAADVSSPPRLTPSPEAEDPKTLSIKWPDQVKCTEKRRICWVGPLYTSPGHPILRTGRPQGVGHNGEATRGVITTGRPQRERHNGEGTRGKVRNGGVMHSK